MVDGDVKIFGIFDGHGPNGQLVSSFVMGQMLDYIQNSGQFRKTDLFDSNGNVSDADMKKALRLCFQYAQDRVRNEHRKYLSNKKRRAIAERI